MLCTKCGSAIPNQAVACETCGTPVAAPLSPAELDRGATLLRATARTFLIIGILNIVVGIVVTASGIITGVVSVLVGVLELINAARYWSSPPSSFSAPKYVAVLEIINIISLGSLWSPIAGIRNLSRLGSREVKGYLALLQAGGSLPAVPSPAAVADPVKRCPRCAETIRLEAIVCRYCHHEFGEAEVKAAQERAQVHAAQLKAIVAAPTVPLYAGFWHRVAAYLIDALICCTIMVLLMGGGAAAVALSTSERADNTQMSWIAVIGFALVFFLYYPLMESSRKQATVGKMAMGVVVTGLAGDRITYARALARAISKIVSALPLNVGFLLAALSGQKQALHDIMARTLVVPKDRVRPWPVRVEGNAQPNVPIT